MNPIPLLQRELQVALRRPITRRLRLGFGGGSMLLVVWSLLVTTGDAGPMVFLAMSVTAAVLAIFVAVFVASDSISRERREGTLGFLFLTDLRAQDVVMGKFSAAGLVPFYTLVAMFPAFALCQLVGGVGAGLFWKTMLALLLTLVFSLCATLYVSSVCEDHRVAFAGTAVTLLIANPLWLLFSAAALDWWGFAAVAFAGAAGAALFFFGAARRLGRHWRDTAKPQRREKYKLGPKVGGELLEKFPIAWMMLRRRGGKRWTIIGAAILVAVVVLFQQMPTLPASVVVQLWVLFLIHLAYQLVLYTRTAYAFYFDRQNGALELFLGSRLTNEEIFAGFNQFLIRQSTGATAMIMLMDIVVAATLWSNGAGPISVLPIAMGLGLWITLFGLGWLGVYRSLMMRHPSLAIPTSYARLSLGPVVFSLLFLGVPGTDFVKLASFYLISSGFVAIFFAMDAKSALGTHGRTLLVRPANEKPPHIESDWSFIDWEEGHPGEMPVGNGEQIPARV